MADRFARYVFQRRSGYIIRPQPGHEQEMVALGHTASLSPWSDPHTHLHTQSWEYYVLVGGRLHFLVTDIALTLNAPEILVVKPGVPHAIIGGEGPIEHFGIRAPGRRDKLVVTELPAALPVFSAEDERTLRCDWGYRIPLAKPEHQNWWLLGLHKALFTSPPMALAYLNFPTTAAANVGKERHRLHVHTGSWEYYVVLNGRKTVEIDEELVTVSTGEILVVPPNVPHCVRGRTPPYQGFTIRAPVKDDKVER